MRKVPAATMIGAMAALAACGTAIAGSEGQYRASSYGYGNEMIIGSGTIVSRDLPIGDVERLAIDGPVDVIVRQGATRSLTVTADDNIIGLVRARSDGGALTLDTTGSFRTRTGITAELVVPRLDKVSINASGDVRFEDWSAREIELVIGGSGSIEMNGRTARITALIGGSGDIDLTRAQPSYVDADIEGSGSIRVPSLAKLDATINGSGTIEADRVGELDAVLNGSGLIRYGSAERVLRHERNGSGRIVRR